MNPLQVSNTQRSRAALISVHPEFAMRILAGEKRVEFRRRALGSGVNRLVIYATSPVRAVVGAADIDRIDRGAPAYLWERHAEIGGIDRGRFFDYFADSTDGFAYLLCAAVVCEPSVRLGERGLPRKPPQAFQYLSESIVDRVLSDAVAIGGPRPVLRGY